MARRDWPRPRRRRGALPAGWGLLPAAGAVGCLLAGRGCLREGAACFAGAEACRRSPRRPALAAAPAAVEGERGWQSYGSAELPEWLARRRGESDFSDIPVFDAQSLPEHVREDPSWADRPFILRGCQRLLDMQEDLSREKLVEAARSSACNISVGYSWSIARNGGEGHERMPLLDYLCHRMHERWYDGDTRLEPAYAFDPRADLPGLPGKEDVHPLIRSWHEPILAESSRLTMVGAAGSAVGWHRHGAATQMTVHGWKRWLLYPLGSYPPGDGPGGGFSITDWLQVVYPTLQGERAPLECIQRPGDTVYVPSGWYHAVANLADSVAVTIQSPWMVPESQDYFKGTSLADVGRLREEEPEALAELIEAARERVGAEPRNSLHARRVLFYALRDESPRDAVEVMLEGTLLDPFHVPLQFELAKWLGELASAGDESALQEFRTAMRSWEPHLRANTRNLKALWILSKYYKLTGQSEELDRFHGRLVELNDRGIDR